MRLTIFKDGRAYPKQDQAPYDDITSVDLSLTGYLINQKEYVILILDGDTGMKRRVEGLMEVITAVSEGLSNHKPEYGSPMTKDTLHIQFTHIMKGVGNLLGYMMNSTSWQKQELMEFDRDEFMKRIDKLKAIIKIENYK